ncbi:hypothetical protein SB861_50645 [Paraburkholderia sp. SIMBA_049]|jgi:hypothetical protein
MAPHEQPGNWQDVGRAALRRIAMSFDDSSEEHQIADVSLRNVERVRLLTSAFANERYCAPGRWMRDDGERWDDAPELLQLELAHASFDAIALVITIFITQGRLVEAAVMLEQDALFENAARTLTDAVARFEKYQALRLASPPGASGLSGFIEPATKSRSRCASRFTATALRFQGCIGGTSSPDQTCFGLPFVRNTVH